MSKAEQYGLNFQLIRSPYSGDGPTVIANKIENNDIASFMRLLGPRLTQSVIDEINSVNAFTSAVSNYEIEGSYEEVVAIYSDPARAVFNALGEDVIMPLQDFLDLLNEWIAFLHSISFQHYLSNR